MSKNSKNLILIVVHSFGSSGLVILFKTRNLIYQIICNEIQRVGSTNSFTSNLMNPPLNPTLSITPFLVAKIFAMHRFCHNWWNLNDIIDIKNFDLITPLVFSPKFWRNTGMCLLINFEWFQMIVKNFGLMTFLSREEDQRNTLKERRHFLKK